MSVEAMKRVKENSTQPAKRRAVLLVLADFTDKNLGVARPSVQTVAESAGMGIRTAQGYLSQIVADGELFIMPGGGRGNAHGYIVACGLTAEQVAATMTEQFGIDAEKASQHAAWMMERQALARLEQKRVHDAARLSAQKSAQKRREKVQESLQRVQDSDERVQESAEKVHDVAHERMNDENVLNVRTDQPSSNATDTTANIPHTRTIASLTKIPPIASERVAPSTLEIPESIKHQPAPPRTDAERKNADARKREFLHPALVLYGSVHGQRPLSDMSPEWRGKVSRAVGEEPDALAKWREVMVEWSGSGYSAKNVKGQIDVFEKGWTKGNHAQDANGKPIAAPNWPRSGPRKSGGTIRRAQVADATDAERDAARERARKRIEERAAQKAAQAAQGDTNGTA